MSDISSSADYFDDESFESEEAVVDPPEDQVGMTSEEAETTSESTEAEEAEQDEKKSLLSTFTIFDGMLLLALVFISLATLLLFIELNTFGSFPGSFPWRTSEFLNMLMF